MPPLTPSLLAGGCFIYGVDYTFNTPPLGTNLSIKVFAKPPTIGIFPTNPCIPSLFLLNMFLKNPPTLDQKPGFLVP